MARSGASRERAEPWEPLGGLEEARLVGADAAKVARVAELGEVEHVHAQLAPRLQRRRVERGHHHLPMPADGAHLRRVVVCTCAG